MTTQLPLNSSSENPSGEARFQRANRHQIEMITLSLDQRLDVDHPVRAVWNFVEQLDLSELYSKIKAVRGNAGAAPIDPRILFALWMYATLRGISSGRRINELCDPQLGETAFQWLCGDVSVNYHTINDFRTAHPECLDGCLTQSVGVLIHEGLVSLERVAQDGMRVRADASGKSFRRVKNRKRTRPRDIAVNRPPKNTTPRTARNGLNGLWSRSKAFRPKPKNERKATVQSRDVPRPIRTLAA